VGPDGIRAAGFQGLSGLIPLTLERLFCYRR
jgi:hypothetical protein